MSSCSMRISHSTAHLGRLLRQRLERGQAGLGDIDFGLLSAKFDFGDGAGLQLIGFDRLGVVCFECLDDAFIGDNPRRQRVRIVIDEDLFELVSRNLFAGLEIVHRLFGDRTGDGFILTLGHGQASLCQFKASFGVTFFQIAPIGGRFVASGEI